MTPPQPVGRTEVNGQITNPPKKRDTHTTKHTHTRQQHRYKSLSLNSSASLANCWRKQPPRLEAHPNLAVQTASIPLRNVLKGLLWQRGRPS